MQNLKVDFEKWLIHVKKYKTLPNGKSHSADFYKSKINKVCENFYYCKDNEAWKQLADEILPVLMCYFIRQLPPLSAKQKQEIFDLLHTLKQSENLKNFSFFEVINHSEAYPLIFNNTKVEIGKTKKALLLYYEFLKHIAYKQSDYDNFDKIIQQVQDFCDNTIKFITNLPTLNSPQEIIRVGKDGDYIDDEGASKLTGISKTTLYEMAKNGLIEKESSQSYFVDSLNKYFKDNHHIAEATIKAGISSTSTRLFSSKEAAAELGCDESMLKYYRDKEKISYKKTSPGSYSYFPDDVKRLKKELAKKKRIRKKLKNNQLK